MAEDAQAGCEERHRLRDLYHTAVVRWIDAGGLAEKTKNSPQARDAKDELDKAALELVNHRREHGCAG